MDQFNAPLFAQPFCQLDEGLPGGAKQTSALIRKMVGRSEHYSNQKNQAVVKVQGTVRLIITANNDAVLLQLAAEDYSEDDLDAFVNRMLHLRGQPEAAAMLIAHNAKDRATVDGWIQGDKIAKHAIWLALNRPIASGQRFLVEGEPTEMHRALVTRGDKRGAVLEWLAKYMSNPKQVDQAMTAKDETPLVVLGEGRFLVNTKAVSNGWGVYCDEKKLLTITEIGRVLGKLGAREKPRLGPRGGPRHRYHVINPDHVISWATGDVQVGDEDTMRANLHRPLSAKAAALEESS